MGLRVLKDMSDMDREELRDESGRGSRLLVIKTRMRELGNGGWWAYCILLVQELRFEAFLPGPKVAGMRSTAFKSNQEFSR